MTKSSENSPPPWVGPFLSALEAGQGVKAAIASAGVACSTLYTRRKRDPDFARAWDVALAPHGIPGDRRAHARRRGSTKVDRFIDKLTETSDVAISAAHAGVTRAWVHRRRRDDPEFRRRWRVALAAGYDSLEMALLARLRSGRSAKPGPDAPNYDNAAALRCLAAHRESVTREKGRRALEEECATIASINAKIDALRFADAEGRQAIAEARAANKRRAGPGRYPLSP